MRPADPSPSHRAIDNLIATYVELVDAGDFAAVGELLVDATFTGGAGSVSRADAIDAMLPDNVIVYDDGTPRTKHLVTNVAIEIDDEAGTAAAGKWRFVERRVRTDLLGDMSRHLRRPPGEP